MIVAKRVLTNKKTRTKYVIIPINSDIQPGDYVKITKVSEKEEDGDRNNGVRK